MPQRPWHAPQFTLLAIGVALASIAHAGAPTSAPIEQRLSPAQMHETGLDTLRPEQLALLNRLLQETAPAIAVPPVTAPPPAATTGDVSPLAPDPTAFAGVQDGPQKAELVGTLAGWQPGTVLELRNGQQWQVLKGQWHLSKPLSNAPVTLVPGVMGRWFLEVDENIPKARVQRIR